MSANTVSVTAVRIVASFYILCGLFGTLASTYTSSVITLLVSVTAVAGGLGVWLKKPWSAHLVAAASVPVVATWLYYLAVNLYRMDPTPPITWPRMEPME